MSVYWCISQALLFVVFKEKEANLPWQINRTSGDSKETLRGRAFQSNAQEFHITHINSDWNHTATTPTKCFQNSGSSLASIVWVQESACVERHVRIRALFPQNICSLYINLQSSEILPIVCLHVSFLWLWAFILH